MKRKTLGATFVAFGAVATLLGGSMAHSDTGERVGEYRGGFVITGDRVTLDSTFTARVQVLGAQITYSGLYDIPVTLDFAVGGTTFAPFGSYDSATGGNVNSDAPREFTLPQTVEGGASITFRAKSWIKKNTSDSGTSDSHYKAYLSADTAGNSSQVMALRDGDIVPDLPGFMGQNAISEIVRDYIDPTTREVHLDEHEVLYLFELGSTDLSSSSADFQDLVVLVTFAKDERYYDETYIRTLTATSD